MSKNRIQSLGEEIANSVSHGAGTLLSIAAAVIAIVFATLNTNALGVVTASLYGASLIVLYLFSTLYHSLTNKKAKRVFRIFDHCSIFVLICGTYIPMTLSLIGGALGWVIFGIIAGCTVGGIILNSINLDRFSKPSLVLYVIMGWMIVFSIPRIIKLVSAFELWFLILGGIFYTLGIIFYKLRHKYMHFIWHLFVIAGSAFHYFFILMACYMK